MPDFEEKALCRKVGGVFELSAQKGYEVLAFTKLWLKSQTADHLYHWNCNEVAQSKQYLLHSIELEYGLTDQDACSREINMEELMYWGGYILTYLSFTDRMEPKEIEKQYDLEKVLECYDTLHTLSAQIAVDKIKEEFRKERNQKNE